MNRDFKGIWIPREIWLHKELLPLEIMLWAEIHSLHCRERKGCYASNQYFSDLLRVSERYIREMISHLKKLGFIEDVSFDGRVRIIRAILPKEIFDESLADRNHSSGGGGTTVPVLEEPQFRQGTPSPYIVEKSLEKRRSGRRAPRRPAPAPIIFDEVARKFSGITDDDRKAWKEKFPNLDIENQLELCAEWALGEPRQNYRKSILTWFTNASKIDPKTKGTSKEDRALAEKIHDLFKKLQRQDFHMGPDYVEFVSGGQSPSTVVMFGDKNFTTSCFNELNKRKLKIEKL